MYAIAAIAIWNKKNKVAGLTILFTLFIFSFLRGESVGTDTTNAMQISTILTRSEVDFDITNFSTYEISTNLVYRIIKSGRSPRLIIEFYSIVTFLFLYLACRRFKINLSILMFGILISGFYIYSYNIARQYTAISVCLYALSFIFDKSWKKSLLFFPWMIFAISIHTSSLFFLPLYLVRYLNPNKITISAIIIGSLIFGTLGDDYIRLFFMEILANDELLSYSNAYSDMITDYSSHSFMGMLFKYLTIALYIYAIIILYKSSSKYTMLLTIAVGILCFTYTLPEVLYRTVHGFDVIAAMLLCYYFTISKEKYTFWAYAILFTYKFFVHGINDPYVFAI